MFNLKKSICDIKEKSHRLLTNCKGVTSFEAVVGLMIIMVVVAGIVDFSNSNVQFSNVSGVTNYLSRIVSEQGGISNVRPSNYYDDVYTTSQQAYNYIDSQMKNNGYSDWKITITTPRGEYEFEPSTSIAPLEYESDVVVKLTFTHELKLLKGFLSLGDIQKESVRSVKTTLHQRESDIEIII